MKIDKIIFSSDDSHYLDFWKINSEITLKKLGITPQQGDWSNYGRADSEESDKAANAGLKLPRRKK